MANDKTLDLQKIEPGTEGLFELTIARLPTHTAVELPIIVYRGHESGHGLLLTAGIHGDEINGIEILRRMIRAGSLQPHRGVTIVIPVVNVFGFIHSSRRLPEGKDLNRSFPGSGSGSLSAQVAHVLMNRVIPLCDSVVDLHTGGGAKYNLPQVRCDFRDPGSLELARVFSPTCILNSRPPEQSFRKEVARKGKPCITFEGGESMRLDQRAIDIAQSGIQRVMAHHGMIDDEGDPVELSPEYAKTTWVRAPYTGILTTLVETGDSVSRGELLGYIADPFGEREITIKAKRKGLIVGINNRCIVHKGEAIINIALA